MKKKNADRVGYNKEMSISIEYHGIQNYKEEIIFGGKKRNSNKDKKEIKKR